MVRFRGMATHAFELVGGHPFLDFLNTISDWTSAAPRDYIPDFGEAVRFGEVAGVLTRAEARRLSRVPSGREMKRLCLLRGALERVARALSTGTNPYPADLAAVSALEVQAWRASQLRPSEGALARAVELDRVGSALLRLRLTMLAVELLSSTDEMQRLKTCPSCGWFFLDVSKNRSRRWCSMQTCGASAKAKRYYWRSRKRRNP